MTLRDAVNAVVEQAFPLQAWKVLFANLFAFERAHDLSARFFTEEYCIADCTDLKKQEFQDLGVDLKAGERKKFLRCCQQLTARARSIRKVMQEPGSKQMGTVVCLWVWIYLCLIVSPFQIRALPQWMEVLLFSFRDC